jgi:hypothetical protein
LLIEAELERLIELKKMKENPGSTKKKKKKKRKHVSNNDNEWGSDNSG